MSLLSPGTSTNLLGVFNVANLGWGTWQWAQMVDGAGNPTKVTLDGSAQILRMGGTSGNEVNVNFLMLVATAPTPTLTATVSGGTFIFRSHSNRIQLSAAIKNNLTDAIWNTSGGAITGNGSIQTANDAALATAGSIEFKSNNITI